MSLDIVPSRFSDLGHRRGIQLTEVTPRGHGDRMQWQYEAFWKLMNQNDVKE